MIFARLLWLPVLALLVEHSEGALECLLDAFEIVCHGDNQSTIIFKSLKAKATEIAEKQYIDLNDHTDDMSPVLTLSGLLEAKLHEKRFLTTSLKETLRLSAYKNGVLNRHCDLLAKNYLQQNQLHISFYLDMDSYFHSLLSLMELMKLFLTVQH